MTQKPTPFCKGFHSTPGPKPRVFHIRIPFPLLHLPLRVFPPSSFSRTTPPSPVSTPVSPLLKSFLVFHLRLLPLLFRAVRPLRRLKKRRDRLEIEIARATLEESRRAERDEWLRYTGWGFAVWKLRVWTAWAGLEWSWSLAAEFGFLKGDGSRG